MIEEFDGFGVQWKIICVLHQTNEKQILMGNIRHNIYIYKTKDIKVTKTNNLTKMQ
jgi:hypothetical protein